MVIFLIFPVHLYKDISILKEYDKVYLIQDDIYFTKYNFHKIKLAFHIATMNAYCDYLKEKGVIVEYRTKSCWDELKNKDIHFYDPIDHDLVKIAKKYCKSIKILEPLGFIFTSNDLDLYNETFKNKKKFVHNNSFYKWSREKLNILATKKLSYDEENREKYPKDFKEKKVKSNIHNIYVKNAIKFVLKHYPNNPGTIEDFILPIDHKMAKRWLKKFIDYRLELFGNFQDGFRKDITIGYHSMLSPLLNIGLLTDNDVIKQVLKHNNIPINSLEGFIRQLIGWKQAVRYLYQYQYKKFSKTNYLSHKSSISTKFWSKTLIPPVDDCIEKALNSGYLHHIERLMVMCNFMNLCLIKPNDIFRWFMEIVSIDAYQWTMYPNIYGMGTYADGGFMMSRPYVSTSKYICKMSDYKDYNITFNNHTYSWCVVWDSLYYNFINTHLKIWLKNYFMARQVKMWLRKDVSIRKEYLKIAKLYLKFLNE